MTYSATIGAGGYRGWNIIKRTEATQKDAIKNELNNKSTREHLIANLEKIKSTDDILSDYRLLNVILTAFDLPDDIKNKAFLKKVLESDLSNKDSFANRLSDKRYLKLAQALRAGTPDAENGISSIEIFERFIDKVFEMRVGEQDLTLQYALSARRELFELSSTDTGPETFWYIVLGSTSLRTVFDGAFNLPASFGKLPIDRQKSEYIERSQKMFGSSAPKIFQSQDNIEKLVASYLLRSQAKLEASNTPYMTALSILKSI